MTKVDAKTAFGAEAGGFDYDSIETGHYDRVFRERAGIQSKWHHLKFAHIRAHLGAPARLLDIACGPGTFIGTLDERIDATGVDIAPAQIEYANAVHGTARKRFETVGAGTLPYPDGGFDAATCIELVEHLRPAESSALLAEARRVIAPGGTLLLTTPDYGGAWPALEWLVNRLGSVSYEDQHITHFTRSSLRLLLEETGFEDVRIERYQMLAPFFAALGWRLADRVARLEPRWFTRRFGFLLFATAR